jgi:phosphoribosylaminoimidazole carboxylase (NCAIR synthetase)
MLGRVPCVLEQRLALALELSVVVARTRDGAVSTFPVAENAHRDGILAVSVVPARISPAPRAGTRRGGGGGDGLDYVGVLCVEFFVLADGRLLANEIAPRPHNSGHYTIDACVGSQFEQQARVLAGAAARRREPAGAGRHAECARRRLGSRAGACASRTGPVCWPCPAPSCICTARARRGAAARWVT